MPLFSPQNLAAWTGGEWNTLPENPISSVVHDSRNVSSGALYVALPGERHDGHEFIEQAHQAGAAASLCQHSKAAPGLPCLQVPDPGLALQRIATGYRGTLTQATFIGITGSAGKTTVKDFVSAMLQAEAPTCATRGNWNNFIGLPLSLLAMQPTDTFGAFELGMNRPGEIAALSQIARPSIGVITSIGEAHLENLGSIQAIAKEKTSLLACLPPAGQAILDLDSEWYSYSVTRCNCPYYTISLREKADFQGRLQDQTLWVTDHIQDTAFSVQVPLPGEHMARNLLLAIAIARTCHASTSSIIKGCQAYTPAPMRWQKSSIGNYHIINDAYNANPLSMRKSIDTFSTSPSPHPKWAILGGMAELGKAAKALHHDLGRYLDQKKLSGVLLIGEQALWIKSGLSQTETHCFPNKHEAAYFIQEHFDSETTFLLKGSRSENLEQLLPLLTQSKGSSL